MKMSLYSDMMDTIITEQLANIMVLPNRIVVPMVPNVDLMMLKYPPPDVSLCCSFLP